MYSVAAARTEICEKVCIESWPMDASQSKRPLVIVLACHCGPQIGFGHLMRCRAIADFATRRGIAAIIVGPPRAYRTDDDALRFTEWIEYPPVDGGLASSDKLGVILEVTTRAHAKHVMLDDYTISGADQMTLRQAGIRVLHQYDASAPPMFAADLAVNASPAEHASLHEGRLLNPNVRFLNGPRFAVLRPEFATVERAAAGRDVRRIMVTFGGGGDRGGIEFVVRTLAALLPASIILTVMSSAQNPNVGSVAALIERERYTNVDLKISPPDVPRLLASCDLAVMAGGTSVYEAAYCGLPMVLIAIASNQQGQCQGWERLGAATYLGPLDECRPERLSRNVLALLDDHPARMNMALAGVGNVDLNGAARLLDALTEQD